MLRVRMVSGQQLTSLSVEEVGNVRELKRRLHRLHGFPPRFQQRLILDGASLDDADELASPMDLDLVVLSFSDDDFQLEEDDELLQAAANGSVDQAGFLIAQLEGAT